MSLLSALGLSVIRGGRRIVAEASMTAAGGEFMAVIGPNGAGKSTLLSILAGLLKPDSGQVCMDDKPLSHIKASILAQRRAYLPQNPRCEWPISVERLIALGLMPHLPAFGGFGPAMQARLDTALQQCDLEDRRDQPATTLSGGELARAMLARAMIGEPDILIVDEPMAGLDPRHALDTARRLQSYARAGGLVIASIHDLTFAARYATRIVALLEGKIVADGPTQSTLTSGLISQTFDVEACVSGGPGSVIVDYINPL